MEAEMIIDSDGRRYYTCAEGEALEGKTVICDMAQRGDCDGKGCGHFHDHAHTYHEMELECFTECWHKGKNGFCIEVTK
jgi:hypothetical protein